MPQALLNGLENCDKIDPGDFSPFSLPCLRSAAAEMQITPFEPMDARFLEGMLDVIFQRRLLVEPIKTKINSAGILLLLHTKKGCQRLDL